MTSTSPHAAPRSGWKRTLAAAMAAATLASAALVGTTAAPASAATTLAGAAGESGRYFGTAIAESKLGDPVYTGIVDREFDMITAENEMKWDATEPTRGTYTYTRGDTIVNRSLDRGQQVRGHALLWYQQQPAWAKAMEGPDLRTAALDHVREVATHYKGKVYAWDVVNEAFADDGSGGRRDSNLERTGSDWIEAAFRTAREADPNAKLCYNDYGTDGINAKSTGVYEMVKDFKARGVPIDCVGFQTHLDTTMPENFQSNLQRFADLGVDVQITELDIAQGPNQTAMYDKVVRSCTNIARCTGITVWGVRDTDSWRDVNPLLFDGAGNPKPAYDTVLTALNDAGTGSDDGGLGPAVVDTDATYVLVNKQSGKALDVYNMATGDGADIVQWDRNDGLQQQWQFVDSGYGWYRLKSKLSGKVLDDYNFETGNGAEIVQWTDLNQENQQFRADAQADGYVTLVNRTSDKALEVEGGSTESGANVVLYDNWGGANQQWKLVRIG